MLGAFISAQAYDFSSQTRYSVEEALDSVWLYYSINPDGTTVSVTQGPESYKFNHIRIPETVTHNDNTYTVTEVAYQAFSGGNIDIVEMANTITKIGDYAFYQCGLDSIKFSTSLKSIGELAFARNSLTAVCFPEGLETIGKAAFAGAADNLYSHPTGSINTILFPSSLKEIGESAFANNAYLVSVVIPENITEIKPSTFSRCWQLKNVVLPEKLNKIGNSAFANCALTELDVDFFPKTLVEIGDGAFSYNVWGRTSSLKKVVLPDNIQRIGTSCFSGTILESIVFSSGMTELPNSVCDNCPKLVEVKIPNSITKIGERAFASTDLLSHIELPATITEIGTDAFNESGLVTFNIPPAVDSVPNILSYCDYLEEITIPESVSYIGPSFLKECKSLRKISLPESITHIPDYFANGCVKLEEVNIPKSVITMDDAFSRCSSLKKITIYHNMTEFLGSYSFLSCDSLKEVHIKTAIPPIGKAFSQTSPHCTLYVPTGSKATYEASKYWNNFDTIVEEEIGYDILYRVSASKVGQGSIAINGEAKTSVDILSGSKVGVTFTPASGWKLKSVVLNDKDVTASLVENVYEVETLEANMVFVATFEELPATLSLRSADGGSIDVAVVKGTTFSCVFTPDENWTINNVRYNNSDVTSSVSDAGEYTTPVIKNDAILSVAYETGDNSVDAISIDADMKAYVLTDGLLVVEGVEHGMPVVVYDVDGKVLSSLVAVDGRCSYQLPDAGVYVVKGVSKSIKVIF